MAASDWILATRPKTLAAGIVPVIVGACIGAAETQFNVLIMLACLGGALCIQIACNFINDALDAIKGADTEERIGPKRAVASGAISARSMLIVSMFILAAALGIGIYLSLIGGWIFFILGIVSIICAYTYTGGPYPLAYIGLGDVFVFLFFGLFAVLGSAFLQVAGANTDITFRLDGLPITWWLIAAAIGFQATAIIAVNNLRDIETDQQVNKNTLAVRMGAKLTKIYIFILHLAAASALFAAANLYEQTLLFISAGIALCGGLGLSIGIARAEKTALNKFLGLSAALEMLTGLSLVICLAL